MDSRTTEADVRRKDVPLLVGYGGGANSCAVLIGLKRRDLRPDLITFADTADEKPETYFHINLMDTWLRAAAFPAITRVKKASPRAGYQSLEEECLKRQTLPSRAFGMSSCAHRWKIQPQEKFLNHWIPARECWAAGRKPIKVIGIDAGEAHRSKLPEDAKLRYWYPLVEWGWDREDCIAAIEEEGLPVPVKSACFYCPSSKKTEVLELAQDHPDLLARALALEAHALKNTTHPLKTVKGLGRRYSWASLISSDEAARAAFAEAPVEGCVICQDGGCDV